MKTKEKLNKGITLIALIVTIVILLILAGIAITALTVDNGLFTRTQQAKQKTVEAEEKENQIIGDYENTIDKLGIINSSNRENLTGKNVKIYVDGEEKSSFPAKGDGYAVSEIKCENGATGEWDSKTWSLKISGITTTDISCEVYFTYIGNVRKNLNIENVKSYSADGYSESNVPGNAIDDKMDTGNGRNWYGGTKLLIEYNSVSYFDEIGVYTTDNWGISFNKAKIYYSEDDSLNLNSDLSTFKSITVDTGKQNKLPELIKAKRVMLVKEYEGAVYEFKCIGYIKGK